METKTVTRHVMKGEYSSYSLCYVDISWPMSLLFWIRTVTLYNTTMSWKWSRLMDLFWAWLLRFFQEKAWIYL